MHWIIRLILFIIIFVVGYLFVRASHNVLFRNPENKNALITNGILGHVRHPMYFGVLLFYLACLFLSISLISVAIWVVIIIIYNGLATFEEKQLEQLFGQEYFEYKAKVPKWIPR